jgi:hypothetical protein
MVCHSLENLVRLVDTILFHVNAVNGEDVRQASKKSDVFEGLDIIQGPRVEGFLRQTEPKAVVLLDEFLQVSLPRRSFPSRTYQPRCW